MDISKCNLETATDRKNLTDNDIKMSLESSKVPPINNNENFEFFDDSMLCEDDWFDFDDDDEDKDDQSQSDTSESQLGVTGEVPPKNERPSSAVTFASPKRKKTKFPNFDELLQNLNFYVLNLNLTRLLFFLRSTVIKELPFLFTLKEYEQFFKMIFEDVNILKSKSLDDSYRTICDKIINAASGYLLTYAYEYKPEYQKTVLVIKKELNKQYEDDTSSSDVSRFSRLPGTDTISSGFKIHFLRTMLAFVKYDETKTKEFPELSPDQARYMKLLLESDGTFIDLEQDSEVKLLYRALWEAMKIYSLKYEFKIKCVDGWCGTKNLTFKKIPRQKAETDVDSNQIMNLKSETQDLETPIPDVAETLFAKPEIPNLPAVQQPEYLTKRLLKDQIRLENEVLYIRRLPPQFVLETLNSVLNFLLDDERDKLVLLPKNQPELCFHRRVIDWCRTGYSVSTFGVEFERLHYRISSLLPRFEIKPTKPRTNKINEITGVKEVSYIKKQHKYKPVSLHSVQSARKKKKVNIQNVLKLAGNEQIKLASVVDLNQSLRNKKKNKKQKKAKYLRANAVASNEASSKAKVGTDDSSSTCSSRAASQDRAKAQPVKRSMNENQSARNEAKNWRKEEIERKEQLKEALSVPVQSDKAERMMRGMGWSGGALGARGVGITEPLMPKIDITTRAGFGHVRSSQSETNAKKPKETKTTSAWVAKNPQVIEKVENDIIVKETKQIPHENPTFDSIIKTVEIPKQLESNVELAKPNVELPKLDVELPKLDVELAKPNVELPKLDVELSKPNVELPKPNVELPKPDVELSKPDVELSEPDVELAKPNVELPKLDIELSKPNVELPKPNDELPKPNVELSKPDLELSKPDAELPKPNVELSKEEKLDSPIVSQDFTRQEFLMSIFELINADATHKTLNYQYKINVKGRKFVKNFVMLINRRKLNYSILRHEEYSIYAQIQFEFKRIPGMFFEVKFSVDFKSLEIIKWMLIKQTATEQMPTEQMPTEQMSIQPENPLQEDLSLQSTKPNSEIITEEYVKSFISSTKSQFVAPKANSVLKFKIIFLFNVLNFVKSPNEESEVIYNKILTSKQKNYIQNVVDEVNMRIKFGSTPAEMKLCEEIKEHIEDAFLGVMFNHHYTVVTLNKYFRFKRLNGPDNAVKRKCQTTVNLDIYKSETSQATLNTRYELTDRENSNKAAENNSTVAEHSNKVVEYSNNKDILPESSVDDIIDDYDSDESSVEEYDNNNAREVPKLPPGEEGVNLSNFICLYDKVKTNTSDVKDSNINNGSASKLTENITNKTNIGNGNVVIDNNDNQFIDMNRDGNAKITDIKMTEKEMSAIHSEIKCSDVVDLVNLKDNIFEERTDGVLSNRKPTDRRVMVASRWANNDMGNASNNINDTDVVMKEEVVEMMEATNTDGTSIQVAEIKENINITPSDGYKVKQETDNLDIKTECDSLSKGNIVLSENNFDTQSVAVKIGTERDVPNFLNDQDSEIKTVRILHSSHPTIKLSNEEITEIQRHVSNSIILSIQLPLLKCHGVQNGALIYTCHNQNSYNWLQNIISAASCVNVLNTVEVTKMILKFCCVFDCHYLYVCKMLELYNKGLSTQQWVVEKTERNGDHIIFIVKMDKFSIKFIQESDFTLFAGVDQVQFSPSWE